MSAVGLLAKFLGGISCIVILIVLLSPYVNAVTGGLVNPAIATGYANSLLVSGYTPLEYGLPAVVVPLILFGTIWYYYKSRRAGGNQ